jgi:large subunit ribosomal protein L20
MPRVLPGHATRRRHKKVLRAASGFRASRSTLYRSAKPTLIKAGVYATRDRRARKREFRALWITRVSAACDARGISYSKFMNGLKNANVILNRKMLSEVAIADPAAFDKLTELAKSKAKATA